MFRGRFRAAPFHISSPEEISAMKTYTATFRTDAEFATRDFEAQTPEQALALAQKL
jgi:hypothetical protein